MPKVSLKAYDIFAWIEWIVLDNFPIGFVERVMTSKNTNLSPIYSDTVVK